MSWQKAFLEWLKVFGIGSGIFVSIGGAVWGGYIALLKWRNRKKIVEKQLSIDEKQQTIEEKEQISKEVLLVIAENKALKEEYKTDRHFLKDELDEERQLSRELAQRVIDITTSTQQVVFESQKLVSENKKVLHENEILRNYLKKILGMENLINVKNIKISVLEDNKDHEELLHQLLRKNGIENVSFEKDPEVFIKNINPDTMILIIDQHLNHGMTGMDVIKKIIELRSTEFRYFIMLSGYEDFKTSYEFRKLVKHGIYILKGDDDLIIRSIKEIIPLINILSDTGNEIKERNSEKV